MTRGETVQWGAVAGRLAAAAATVERSVSRLTLVLSGSGRVSAPYLLPLELDALVR
ncbi:hypothetical protein [Geodermatophilus sp. SYSU D00710]